MSLEDELSEFTIWSTKLGFPLEDMANDAAIKTILKSRQGNFLRNLMDKVRPLQDVIEIRENILIRQMEKLKDQVFPTCSRNFLPKKFQNYLKVKDLIQRKTDLESKLADHKTEYDSLSSSIKMKNMQCIKLGWKQKNLQTKVNMLEAKLQNVKEDTQKEIKNKEKILLTTPVKYSQSNAQEIAAFEAINEALKQLDMFYNLQSNNTNQHELQDAKNELWKKLRLIFASMPNFLIFKAISHLKESQLQDIIELNKTITANNSSSHQSMKSSVFRRKNYTTFDIKLMKSKLSIIVLASNYIASKREVERLNTTFTTAYKHFVEEIQDRVKLFNTQLESEESEKILSEYIVQYNTRSFFKAQNESLAQQIEQCKILIETQNQILQDHEILLGSIKQVYEEINTSINQIQYEKLQLNFIKEKILYLRGKVQHSLDCLQSFNNSMSKSNTNLGKLKTSNTSVIGDSFESIGDKFCSTKLDFDCSIISRSFQNSLCEPTLMSNIQRCTLPPYSSELSLFNEIPIEKFNCISKECAYYLSPNPLIVNSHELSSTTQLAPGILLSPYGAIQEVRERIKLSKDVQKLSVEKKLEMELVSVDSSKLRQKVKENHDAIAELLDKIDIVEINTVRSLQKLSKFYDFLIENPLRHYIPPTKLFNNQKYSDYESEYSMYYRVATVGSSIK